MDVYERLEELTTSVERARALPMSASCVVHRGDTLALLDEIRELLPVELREAQSVLAQRQSLLDGARAEAVRVLDQARAEQARLVEQTEVHAAALAEADRLRAEAVAETERMRRETDDYVATKLEQFEIVLGKTLAAVHRGREKLTAGDTGGALGAARPDEPLGEGLDD